MEYGNYKLELNFKTGRFDVYKKGVGFIISCLSRNAGEQIIAKLQEDDNTIAELNKKAEELNAIKEPNRDRSYKDIMPANDNSRLNSPIAKATREILNKTK